MKYSAKKTTDGKWAVFTGKKYFTDTLSESEAFVKEQALLMSMSWHQSQIDLAWSKISSEAEKTNRGDTLGIQPLMKDGSPERCEYGLTTLSDFLC